MKPMNWISATGFKPVSAMPNAVPTIADSASGVSKTRCAPKRACRPSVARKTPPSWPTSWPITTTRGSLSSAWPSARLIAWTMTVSATATTRLDEAGVARVGQGLGACDRGIDVVEDLRAGGRLVGAVPRAAPLQVGPQPREWIALAPGVDLVRGLVAARIVGRRMCADAVGQGLDQHRSSAAARVLERPMADRVHRERVV